MLKSIKISDSRIIYFGKKKNLENLIERLKDKFLEVKNDSDTVLIEICLRNSSVNGKSAKKDLTRSADWLTVPNFFIKTVYNIFLQEKLY